MALFRISELSGGLIEIDGVDTRSVGLKELRSKLGIIPQEPVLFSRTVRFNLDPFDEFEDEELWKALEKVHLKDVVADLPNKLQTDVQEGGGNFSVGQRQLFCIARAMMRSPRVLILDEATASIDNATDQLIQETLRSTFKDTTMLTIAHRLHTILDSDRVLVMEDGQIREFDTVPNLMNLPGGVLKGMVDASRHGKSSTSCNSLMKLGDTLP